MFTRVIALLALVAAVFASAPNGKVRGRQLLKNKCNNCPPFASPISVPFRPLPMLSLQITDVYLPLPVPFALFLPLACLGGDQLQLDPWYPPPPYHRSPSRRP